MNKLFALWTVLRQGEQLANSAFWKKGQAYGQPVIAALLGAVVVMLKGTPYELHISDGALVGIAGGIFSVVNGLLTIATTSKLGLLPAATPAAIDTADDARSVYVQHADEILSAIHATAERVQADHPAAGGPFEPDRG